MLGAHFLPHLATTAGLDANDVEAALERAVGSAQAAHPAATLAPETFVAFLASKVGDAPPLETLAQLRIEDLYLACAAGHGDPAAIAAVEAAHFTTLGGALGHLRPSADLVDEVKQELRERLLTRKANRSPRILEYGGKGGLSRWIRAVAVRAAIDRLRGARHTALDADDALVNRAVPGDDPEVLHMKERYGPEFKGSIREALAALEPAARNTLRLYYVDGLTLDELAALERVNASTISRRLADARRRVLVGTRREMRRRLGVADEELDTILRVLGSRLELTFSEK